MQKTLITQLRICRLADTKPNFAELGRIYNVDWRTVKKYYDGYEGKPKHHNKPSKLDPYISTIEAKLAIKGATVRAVYEYMCDQVDTDIGTYSNFNKYVKSKGLKPKKSSKGHPRYETPPGFQAQVDWKEDISMANCHGEIFTFQVFDFKLGYSRYPVFIYKLSKTRQDVFDCLIACFREIGGVPQEILFDNMASVVDVNGQSRKVNQKMQAFAKDFNFKIRLCKPRAPWTKGKVEVINKFLAWLLPYEGEFETEDELADILQKIHRKVCMRVCEETGVPPLLLFQKEKEYLQPLPNETIIDSYCPHDRQTIVGKDSLVTFNRCKYSVPAEYIGKPVRLQVRNDVLHIYHNTEVIASHVLSEKRINYHSDHYRQLLAPNFSDEDTIAEIAARNLEQLDRFL
ncbi:MAG: IS21 family transposase [Mogibacterium sp.]|nr:IS21 family transposase [Mogibacterium sp.]MCF0144056.1 IS21 family transposase [Bacillota bacterium]